MIDSDKTLIQGRGSAAISRRQIIRLAGLSSALTLSPKFAKAAEFLVSDETPNKVSEIMQQLSAYMAAAATRALPEEVSEKAKQHILDTFAAMISGSQLTPGRSALSPGGRRADAAGRVSSPAAQRWNSRALTAESKWPPWWLPILSVAPLKRHSLTACWPTPTKPTIRTDHHAHIPASPPFQRVLLRAKNTPSAEHSSCALLLSDTTLERACR